MRFLLSIVLTIFISNTCFSETTKGSKHILLPFTSSKYLTDCSQIFNEKEVFEESLKCANDKVFSKEPYNTTLDPEETFKKNPKCFIVSKDSPDVINASWGNYINFSLLVQAGIVGFYDDKIDTIFIIENFDQRLILLHELQHFFLRELLNDADAPHVNRVWKECLPQYFKPTKAQLDSQKNK